MQSFKGLEVEAWFDGACGPYNPGGIASYGALVKFRGDTIWRKSLIVGQGPSMSCNVAEYAGFLAVVEKLLTFVGPQHRITIKGDSNLVVRQMNGKWQAKDGLYLSWYWKAKEAWNNLKRQAPNVRLTWIPREQNGEADKLSKALVPESAHFVPRSTYLPKKERKTIRRREGQEPVEVTMEQRLLFLIDDDRA